MRLSSANFHFNSTLYVFLEDPRPSGKGPLSLHSGPQTHRISSLVEYPHETISLQQSCCLFTAKTYLPFQIHRDRKYYNHNSIKKQLASGEI